MESQQCKKTKKVQNQDINLHWGQYTVGFVSVGLCFHLSIISDFMQLRVVSCTVQFCLQHQWCFVVYTYCFLVLLAELTKLALAKLTMSGQSPNVSIHELSAVASSVT